jgi:hypothetical protein
VQGHHRWCRNSLGNRSVTLGSRSSPPPELKQPACCALLRGAISREYGRRAHPSVPALRSMAASEMVANLSARRADLQATLRSLRYAESQCRHPEDIRRLRCDNWLSVARYIASRCADTPGLAREYLHQRTAAAAWTLERMSAVNRQFDDEAQTPIFGPATAAVTKRGDRFLRESSVPQWVTQSKMLTGLAPTAGAIVAVRDHEAHRDPSAPGTSAGGLWTQGPFSASKKWFARWRRIWGVRRRSIPASSVLDPAARGAKAPWEQKSK